MTRKIDVAKSQCSLCVCSITLQKRWSALEKLANMEDCLGFTASEMTGAGTNMDVMAYCTLCLGGFYLGFLGD